jgi:hypothetical protein
MMLSGMERVTRVNLQLWFLDPHAHQARSFPAPYEFDSMDFMKDALNLLQTDPFNFSEPNEPAISHT